MSIRVPVPRLTVLLAAVCLWAGPVAAQYIVTKSVEFDANTTDLHISAGGVITSVTTDPPTDSQTLHQDLIGNANSWSGAWNSPPKPQGGKVKLTIKAADSIKGTILVQKTTTGALTEPTSYDDDIPVGYTQTHGDPMIELFFANHGDQPVSVTNITLTVLTDLSLLESDAWETAVGTDYSFPDGMVAADSVVSWNADPISWISADATDWIRVSADIDGETTLSATLVKVPEPTALTLLAIGGLALPGRARRRQLGCGRVE
ncbi:MAG: hypothetical protein IT442_13510 [Phycisphaeraceae bacterium]|nr:hypothetical protein [Phycisphaeraceae bacterium]